MRSVRSASLCNSNSLAPHAPLSASSPSRSSEALSRRWRVAVVVAAVPRPALLLLRLPCARRLDLGKGSLRPNSLSDRDRHKRTPRHASAPTTNAPALISGAVVGVGVRVDKRLGEAGGSLGGAGGGIGGD